MTKQRIEIGIAVAMAILFGSRGLRAILTGHYEGTLKYGNIVNVDGPIAIAYGFGWLGMGVAFLGFVIWRIWPEHKSLAAAWGGFWFAVSGLGWIASQTGD